MLGNISKNTNYLIVKNENHNSNKMDLARKLNIDILSKNNLNYLL